VDMEGAVGGAATGVARATAQVCQAASCLAVGSEQVLQALAGRVAQSGLADVAVKRVGCLGLCAAGPLVRIGPTGALFERVSPGGTGGLLAALRDATSAAAPVSPPAPFFARQVRVVTENSGRIDPEDRHRRTKAFCLVRHGLRGGGAGQRGGPVFAW